MLQYANIETIRSFEQLQLPFMSIEDNSTEKNRSFRSKNKTDRSRNMMSEKSEKPKKDDSVKPLVIVDELLDEELTMKEKAEIDRQAWEWTLDVKKWIWKQKRNR